MKIKINLILILFWAISLKLTSQTCGSIPSPEFIERVKLIALQEQVRDGNTAFRSTSTLGVKFWDVHAPNFTSLFNDDDANSFLETLNSYFFGYLGITFEKCGNVNSVENNLLANFNYSDPFSDQYIYTNYYLPTSINVYVVDDLCAEFSGELTCEIINGVGEFPWSNRIAKNTIFLKRSELLGGYGDILFMHEMGHFFGLIHTFGNVSIDDCNIISAENPNGSNCQTEGDLICDTPADPGLRCPNSYINDQCQFIGTDGFEVYHPLTNNFMSYPPNSASSPFGDRRYCIGGTDGFTQGQYERMYDFVPNRQNLVCQSGGGNGNCSDTYEPNDNRNYANDYFGTLGATPFTTQIEAKIGSSGDIDFFKVRFTQIGYLTLDIPVLPKNYNLYIYKGNILMDYSPNAGTQPEHIFFNVTVFDLNTDYYFVIQGASDQDFDCDNTYTMSVDWYPENGGSNQCPDVYEPNNSKLQASTPFGGIALNQPYSLTVSGCILDRAYDYFKFTVPQSGLIKITDDHDIGVTLERDGVSGGIGNRTGDIQTYSHDQNSTTSFYISVGPSQCSPCGVYTLTLEWTPYMGNGGGGGIGPGYDDSFCPWNPNLYTDRDKKYEPNNSPANAYTNAEMIFDYPGDLPNNLYGYILSPTDIDYYKFKANQYGVYFIDLNEYDYEFECQLFDANQNLLKVATYNSYYGHDMIQIVLPIGEYFIKVYSANGEYHCYNASYDLDISLYEAISGGGGNGNSNPWNCSEAIDLGSVDVYTVGSSGISVSGIINSMPDRQNSYSCLPDKRLNSAEILYKFYTPFNDDLEGCGGVGYNGVTIWLQTQQSNLENFELFLYNSCDLTTCILPCRKSYPTYAGVSSGKIFEFYLNGLNSTGVYYLIVDSKMSSAAFDLTIQPACFFNPCTTINSVFNTFSVSNTAPPTMTVSTDSLVCGNTGQYDAYITITSQSNNITVTSPFLVNQLNSTQFVIKNIPSGNSATLTIINGNEVHNLTLESKICNCILSNPIITPTNPVLCTQTPLTLAANNSVGIETQWFDTLNSQLTTGQTLQVTQPGLYFAESVQISTGCKSERIPVLVSPPNIPATMLITDAACGNNNGGIEVEILAPNNASDFSYNWSNGQTSSNLQNIGSGTYSVTITDINGCSVIRSASVRGATAKVQLFKQEDACDANPNRLIQAFANSYYPIVKYDWNTGDTTTSITSSDFGSYSITVTDSEGCTSTNSIQVENKSFSTLPYITKPSCKGMTDGGIALSVFHGVPPILYQWSNGANEADITNLTKGDYIYTVTDARGCEIVDTLTVEEPDSIIFHIAKISPTCSDSINGSVAVFVEGGTRFYQYVWDNGMTDNKLNQLDGGDYVMTVTDWNGCVASTVIDLSEPDSLDFLASVTPVSCAGQSTGAINIQSSGGVLPHTLFWESGDTTEVLTNLFAGNYQVTITDAHGCKKIVDTEVTEPERINLQTLLTNISCFGANDGSIMVSPSGGITPYGIIFNIGNGSNLSAGQYIVTVTDNNDCSILDTIDIVGPPILSTIINKTDVTCFGDSNGSTTAIVTGGTQPYTYNWGNNLGTTNTINNLSAGFITLNVVDANNCKDSITTTILEPTPLNLEFAITDESCVGKLDGQVTLIPSGGSNPYTYNWNNGETSDQIIDVGTGSYSVTVTDRNNCQTEESIFVSSLPPLTFNITLMPTTCSYTEDGILSIDTIIGVAPFTVDIDHSNSSTNNYFENVTSGQHQVFITDGNGCVWFQNFEILQPLPIDAYLMVNNDSIFMGDIVELSVNSDNYNLTNILWSPSNLVNCIDCSNITSQPFNNQIYKVTVKNDVGCEQQLEQLIKVSKERPIFIPNAFSPNGDNNNDYFTIYGASNAIQIKYLRVFDRWGTLLFEKYNFPLNEPEIGWNGFSRNKQQIGSGVYIYSAEIEFIDKQILKYNGDISILR